jgi:hypothetical protein
MIHLILSFSFMLILPLVIICFFYYNKEKKQVNQPIPQNQKENYFLCKQYLTMFWLDFLQKQGLKISQGDYPVTLIGEKIIVKGNEALDYTGIDKRVNSAIDLNRNTFLNYLNNTFFDYSNKLSSLVNENNQKINNYNDNLQTINYLKYNFPTLADLSEQAKVKREINKLENENINLYNRLLFLQTEQEKTQTWCSIIKELISVTTIIKPLFIYNHQPYNKGFVVDFVK